MQYLAVGGFKVLPLFLGTGGAQPPNAFWKYERYCGPGRRPLAYLLYYMSTVNPTCA